jgi:tetratricopeptide (TPR) repeat protein
MLFFIRFISGVLLLSAATARTPALPEPQNSQSAGGFDEGNSTRDGRKNAPDLQSVGVKGAIDSGGYSASAAVKSQSEVSADMLKLQREELSRFYRSDGRSCSQESQSSDSSALIRVGLADESLAKFDSAEQRFRLASASSPSEQSFFAWGTARIIAGHSDQAVDTFKTALNQFPQSIALMIGLGAATFGAGNSSDALNILFHAAEMDRSNGEPYIFIARIFNSPGTETTAGQLDEMKKLIKFAPENPEANYAYACSLKSIRIDVSSDLRSREIEQSLKHSIALKPAFADAHFQLATLYGERGDYRDAIAEYRKAIETDPNLIEAHYRLGQAYMHAGQRDQAERELELHRKLRESPNQDLSAAKADSANLCPAP